MGLIFVVPEHYFKEMDVLSHYSLNFLIRMWYV